MNILFLTLLDFSSIEESNIYTDLMREFISNGHKVCIISPSEKRKNIATALIDKGIYKILKLKIGNTQKTNIVEKGISTLTLEPIFVRGIKKYFAEVKFDLILYSTPPITLLKAVEYVKQRDSAKTYLLLKDIFPQNAADLGMLRKTGLKGLLYSYFRAKEKKLYRISDYIGCMSQANVNFLLKYNPYINTEIVEVCPNSVCPVASEITAQTAKEIKEKYEIPLDKTIFVYGGNLGKPQGVDFLIECLKSNGKNDKIHFVIAGSGTEYNRLQVFLETGRVPNVQLFKQMPKTDYDNLICACDVGLIFLDSRFTIPNFPSRLLAYMQASMPVLAATDVNTDVGKVIVDGGFGYWCESRDVNEFNRLANLLCDAADREVMGKNARRHLENNFTSKHSYGIIMNHFIQRA